MNGLKLNLGCGPVPVVADWLNYEWGMLPLLSRFPRVRRLVVRLGFLAPNYDAPWPRFQFVDIRKGLPLGDGTAAFIYCSHVLEHLERWESLRILRECRRVLKPGGRLRVVVPDLAIICRSYLEGNTAWDTCRMLWGHAKDVEPAGWKGRLARHFIRPHQWHYGHAEMEQLMRDAGFAEVRASRFREGDFPDLDPLELESQMAVSLYMEAA